MRAAPGIRHRAGAAIVVALVAAASLGTAPASAAPQPWNGRYQMVTYASQKVGTSPANRQPEADFGATFVLSMTCSGGRCVATVVEGPRPSNPTVPQPTRYTWTGSEWATNYEWLWDCLLEDVGRKQWARATSWAFYAPQPDGSLRGSWHTDIAEGPCRGSVIMPVAAVPA